MHGAPTLAAIVLAAATTGCIPKHPSMTARPEVDTAPWTERIVLSEVSGQRYRYMHLPGPSEDATPILLLHGGIFDNRMWLYTEGLARRFEVFAFEMPSESPFYRGRVEDFGDLLLDFLDAVGVSDLYVAGVSAGAWAAVDLASRTDALNVRGLFVISSMMLAISDEEIETRTALSERAMGFEPERLRSIVEYRFLRAEFADAPGDVQQGDIFYVRPYSYYRQLFGSVLVQGARPQATQRITCPVLVLHGVEDETIPLRVAELTPTVFPDASFRALEGYGHAMTFSNGPQIAREMLAFVDERGLDTTLGSALGDSAGAGRAGVAISVSPRFDR